VAWVTVMVALFAPAVRKPFPMLPLPYTPMLVMLGLAVGWIIGDVAIRPDVVLCVSSVAFVLTPLLAFRRWRAAWSIFWWAIACSLWFAWTLGIAYHVSGAWDARPSGLAWDDFMWGYYLYALAHTLAFIACLMAPPGARSVGGKVGFPVVPIASE
jgi:hypothetical protein